MKKVRFLGIFLVILAAVLISAPALASSPPYTSIYGIYGHEIFAGIDIGNNNYGATFVAVATGSGTSGLLAGTNGILSASVNYYGTGPSPAGNGIFGGNWTLTVTKGGKVVGTIIGKVIGKVGGTQVSFVTWDQSCVHGAVTIYSIIIGGTEMFRGITGNGYFQGVDNHASGDYVFGIQVPSITGGLQLVTNN